MRDSSSIQVLNRALTILEALAQTENGLSLGTLANQTGLSKSTVHRILATLKERGYAEQNQSGSYEIGAKLIDTVSCHINALDLQTESRPFLAELRKELDLTTHLGILDGPYVVYVERISLLPSTRLYTQVGYRSPAYCSSMGKCLLACLSGDKLMKSLTNAVLSLSPKTPAAAKKSFALCCGRSDVKAGLWMMKNTSRDIAALVHQYLIIVEML